MSSMQRRKAYRRVLSRLRLYVSERVDRSAPVTIQESGWSRSGTGPMSQILKATAEAFGVKRDEILSRRRHMYLVRARHVAMYLMRETLGASYPVIGRFFAMDHSTVIPAYRGIAAALPTDEKLRERVDLVRAIIAGKTET